VTAHLIDGTYELFRHFYGLRRFNKGGDRPFGAVVGVLNGVLQMIEEGATHLGVAGDGGFLDPQGAGSVTSLVGDGAARHDASGIQQQIAARAGARQYD
jgi:hypothetical protein